MKLISLFTCCLALGIGVLNAEQKKETKGKRAAGAGQQGQQVQHVHQGQGTHRTGLNKTGGTTGAQTHLNSTHTTRGTHHVQKGVSGQQGAVPAVQGNRIGRRAQIKQFNLANANHANIKTVTFNANRRIVGAQNWKGQSYVVFRNYQPIWHNSIWWTAHYPRVLLIGGGWYYWNAGFWYPAWGYDPAAAYYPYDGPIYAYNNLPPDQVVANVQEELRNQEYYHGEVDGLLGPLTRAALADYQRDHGLYTTSAIDEPTMASLGFGGGGEAEQTEQG